MRRVVTDGSVWLLDEPAGRYLRMPRDEQPRPHGWGDATAGPLQDITWHPMARWEVRDLRGVPHLLIHQADSDGAARAAIAAPRPVMEDER